MTRFVAFAALFLLVGGLARAENIVVAEDSTPFTVEASDIVRIPVKGIAGTVVTAKVTGPAKDSVNTVSARVKGKMPIGPGNHEVEIKPTGKGKVTVEITVKPPTAAAKTEKYEFEVK